MKAAAAPSAANLRRPRRIVFGGAALLALAVLLTLGALAWHEHRQLRDIVSERNELLARVLSEQTTRNVDGAALAVATLANLLQRGQPPDGPLTQTALQQSLVNLPFLRGMAVVDANGLVRSSGDSQDVGRTVQLQALGPLPAPGAERLGGQVPGRLLADITRGNSARVPAGMGFLPLVRSVQAPGGQALFVIALLNPNAFVNFQQLALDGPGAAAALASYDGRLIAGTDTVALPAGHSLQALPPFRDFLPRLEHGRWEGAGLRPGTQIAAFRVSSTRPLAVLVEVDSKAALAPWWQLVRQLAAAGVAMLALVTVLTAVAWRSVRAREVARAERDDAQEVAARRGRELDVTIQSLQELIFRTDVQGVLNYANQPWALAQGAGRPLWELVNPAQREAARALFARANETDVRHLQVGMGESGGRQRNYDMSLMPLHERGQLVGFAGSAVDISSRVQAQRRLQAQLAFNELLIDISPLPTSVVDLRGRYVMVNKAWESFTGRKRSDVIGQPVGQHLPAAERAVHEAQDRDLMRTRRPLRYEASARHHDGSVRDVVVSKLLVPGDHDQPAGVLSALIDVTEFRVAERTTREARDAAEEASRAKSEFIANISHELRTPLQSIIGFSELGLRRGSEQPRLAAMFDDIHQAGQRMLALVNDLLEVSKLESTVGTMHLERTDLRGLVRHVVKELQPQLAARQVNVALALGEQPLAARVDPLRFQQVVRNVLANAIRFSPLGSSIRVEGRFNDHGEPQLEVADQGPGIPPGEVEAIFQAFVQSSLTKDGSGGTGLGLAISRKIIEAHGGHITAANGPQGGAVFTIHLPARGNTETMPVPL